MKFINKLALSLPGARNFFLSYVLLSGVGIMPLQLVQLAVILPRWFYRIFLTRTPRGRPLSPCFSQGIRAETDLVDFAELNTPPIISLGTVYPQALLIFLMCLTYSVISPLILLFGTIYFGMGYLVYKVRATINYVWTRLRRGFTVQAALCLLPALRIERTSLAALLCSHVLGSHHVRQCHYILAQRQLTHLLRITASRCS